ncbi:MAG TPA: hypothetical protein VN802_02260 [Stellaceae bacterium]|nr:hypothetical protein [Stellaceae bacterium]
MVAPPAPQAAPQASAASQTCREFQQTITVGGQPQEAHGTTCQQPDGSWKVVTQQQPAPQASVPPPPPPSPQVAAVPVYPPSYYYPPYPAYPYPYPYPYCYTPYPCRPAFYGGFYIRGRFR